MLQSKFCEVFRAVVSLLLSDAPAIGLMKASRSYLVTDVLQQITAEEHLPVHDIKQRLAVLDEELNKVEQEGCQMEDRIRSCLYFEMSVSICN